MANMNLDSDAQAWIDGMRKDLPDIVIVWKYYEWSQNPKPRAWKVKQIEKTKLVQDDEKTKKSKSRRVKESGVDDYEQFLREIEEDPEIRQAMNIYKSDAPEGEWDEDDETPDINEEEFVAE